MGGVPFCVKMRLSQAFESESKIPALRIAVVSGGVQPSSVSPSKGLLHPEYTKRQIVKQHLQNRVLSEWQYSLA